MEENIHSAILLVPDFLLRDPNSPASSTIQEIRILYPDVEVVELSDTELLALGAILGMSGLG